MPYMPASSREPLYVPFSEDLSSAGVQLAVVLASEGEPDDAQYHNADWDSGSSEAVLPVGRDSEVPLAPGEYVVWARWTVGDFQPVRRSGTLTVGAP
ncbi:hypothetical protein ABZW11_26600 [Nonomuraea sp. NPDC004580]|uniref:hypothetical protein n=1 Tax=Nonomuraea sp. NPDC004580 TaxID=3154552 RepID=UPI00339DE2EC